MNTTEFDFTLNDDDMFAVSSLDKTTTKMFKTFNNPKDDRYSDTGQVFTNTHNYYKKNTRLEDNKIIHQVLGGK